MGSGQWPGPEPARSGRRVWASNMTVVLRAGPGLDILFAGRAGPGPHDSVCGPGPGLHNNCVPGLGLGLKSYLWAGPGPKFRP